VARTTLSFDIGRGFARVKDLRRLLNTSQDREYGILRVSGVTSDTETVTVGADVLEIDTLTTPVTPTLTVADTTSTLLTLTNHGLNANDVIKADTEIMKVLAVKDANTVKVVRGWAGTTPATHTNAAVTKSSVTAGRIPLGVLSTSAANFISSFVHIVNNDGGTDKGINKLKAVAIGTTAVLLFGESSGALSLTTTETMANGAFDATSTSGGFNPSVQRYVAVARTATAAEVTEGKVYVPHGFSGNPSVWHVEVHTSAGVRKAWDGAVTFVAPSGSIPGYAIVDNSGATDWAAGDSIHLIMWE
jgi:hypothetical protein